LSPFEGCEFELLSLCHFSLIQLLKLTFLLSLSMSGTQKNKRKTPTETDPLVENVLQTVINNASNDSEEMTEDNINVDIGQPRRPVIFGGGSSGGRTVNNSNSNSSSSSSSSSSSGGGPGGGSGTLSSAGPNVGSAGVNGPTNGQQRSGGGGGPGPDGGAVVAAAMAAASANQGILSGFTEVMKSFREEMEQTLVRASMSAQQPTYNWFHTKRVVNTLEAVLQLIRGSWRACVCVCLRGVRCESFSLLARMSSCFSPARVLCVDTQ
jgi:hypothetical protein